MMRKPFLILLVVSAGTSVLAAGCGSSSSHTPSSTASPTTAGGTTGGAASTSTPTSSSSSGGSSNPAVAQAVTACKASINGASQLSASLKTKLTSLCDKAANGDAAGAKKVAAEVCKNIVNADVPSSAPAALKQQALAACKKA